VKEGERQFHRRCRLSPQDTQKTTSLQTASSKSDDEDNASFFEWKEEGKQSKKAFSAHS